MLFGKKTEVCIIPFFIFSSVELQSIFYLSDVMLLVYQGLDLHVVKTLYFGFGKQLSFCKQFFEIGESS